MSVSPQRSARCPDRDRVRPDGLDGVADDLALAFAGTFTRETIDRFVGECHTMVLDLLLPAPSPTGRTAARATGLTRRFATERLEALAQSDGLVPRTVPEVLFVCVHDGARSQLAALLTAHLSEGRVHARSAGSSPASDVHPLVLDVLAETGVDGSGAYPKPLTDEAVRAADVVVTLGCGDSCPVLPDKHYEDWQVGDPVAGGIDQTRAVRDEIAERVRGLLVSLGQPV